MLRPPPTGENGKTVHADSLGACLAGTRSNARPAATSAAPAAKPTSATVAAVRAEPSGPASQRRSASQWAASLSTAAVNPAAAPVAIATPPGPISAQARVRRALGPATLRCTVSAGDAGQAPFDFRQPGRAVAFHAGWALVLGANAEALARLDEPVGVAKRLALGCSVETCRAIESKRSRAYKKEPNRDRGSNPSHGHSGL
jgi:hypothetical protein